MKRLCWALFLLWMGYRRVWVLDYTAQEPYRRGTQIRCDIDVHKAARAVVCNRRWQIDTETGKSCWAYTLGAEGDTFSDTFTGEEPDIEPLHMAWVHKHTLAAVRSAKW